MKLKRAPRHQSGFVYYRNGAWHVRYYARELVNDVVQSVQRSSKILSDPKHHLTKTNRQVQDARQAFMSKINDETGAGNTDMLITEYWNNVYLPFIREHKRESTVSGYEQIWSQHLEKHFAGKTLQSYRTYQGSEFLLSLTAKQGLRTLNHIRSLISGIFAHALNTGRITTNPGRGIKILGKVKEPAKTEHYTLEEAEDMISALKDHVECQLVLALSCFLGLRPSEIAGLKWEDISGETIGIRRGVVHGVIGVPKTKESIADLPLLTQVRVPLERWRQKCGNPSQGWVFPNSKGKPHDLRHLVRRTIKPVLGAAGWLMQPDPKKPDARAWKGLYAGRRGAGTAVIELTNGNYASAQELLRHKHMSTTLQFYKRQTEPALTNGVKALETALSTRKLAAGEQ